MKRAYILVFCSILFAGCASTYKSHEAKAPQKKLDRSYAVIVHTPADGSFNGQRYAGSGSMTAVALKNEFSKYSANVSLVQPGLSRNSYMGKPGLYYIQPEILHWEERATEWSGKPDRIRVKIDIFTPLTMTHEASVILEGKSKWLTLGGDHPQELLPKPIETYLNTLYK